MSVSSTSSYSNYSQLQYQRAQRAKEMQAIEDAVKTGDITGAQTALKALQAQTSTGPNGSADEPNAIGMARRTLSALDGQTASGVSTTNNGATPQNVLQDFLSAVETGDLSSAQAALKSLQAHRHHPPPPSDGTEGDNGASDAMSALGKLFQAVQSGDSSKAQEALKALQSSETFQQTGPDSTTSLGKDLQALLSAVSGGDMTKAQSALQSMDSDLQAMAPPPPPPSLNGLRGEDGMGNGSATPDMAQSLDSIFEAIEKGDLSTAQSLLGSFGSAQNASGPGQLWPRPLPADYADLSSL